MLNLFILTVHVFKEEEFRSFLSKIFYFTVDSVISWQLQVFATSEIKWPSYLKRVFLYNGFLCILLFKHSKYNYFSSTHIHTHTCTYMCTHMLYTPWALPSFQSFFQYLYLSSNCLIFFLFPVFFPCPQFSIACSYLTLHLNYLKLCEIKNSFYHSHQIYFKCSIATCVLAIKLIVQIENFYYHRKFHQSTVQDQFSSVSS